MSSPNIKRLVWTLSVVFLFSALASWPVRANDEDEFEFTGVISSLPNTAGFIGDWVVGGRTVHVTSSTRIEQEDGSPAVGKTVEVEGVLQQNGTVNATDIEVKSNTESTSEFQFRGRVEHLPSTAGFIGDWIVSGRTIHVSSSTFIQQVEAPLGIGVPVKVIGTLRPDGTIDATKVQTEKVEHTTFFEFTGPVQTLPGTSNLIGDWMIGGRIVHVTSLTQIERDEGPITIGTNVEVKGTVRTDGSIDAVKIEPVEAGEFEFHGIINSLPNTTGFIGDWVVDGRTIHVTSAMRIDQEEGLVAVGAFVEVRGMLRTDGSVDAANIEVERSAGAERPVPTFELHGTIEQLPNTPGLIGDWAVSGRIVHVTSSTIIRPNIGAIAVGTFVEVVGNLRTDNTIDALSVEVEHARGNGVLTPFFALFGTVETLPATTNFVGDWVVSGRTIHVSSSTQIQTGHRPLAVGSFVRVVGTLRSDGSIDARSIQVKRSDNLGHLVNFFELFGTVESTPASGLVGDYRISGLTVHTTSTTHFAPTGKPVPVGSRVKVVGTLRADGTLDANAIVVEGDVDDAHDFVTTHFDDFLNREPDDSGLQFWTNEITKCGSDAQCIELKRVNVSAAFFLSTEFQNTGFLVDRLFVASFGRMPRLEEFLADTKDIGEGVIVGQSGWEQQLEANKQAFIDDWVQHPSFVTVFGGLTNAQFIDALLAHTGFTLTAAQRSALIAGLDNGTLTRGQALRQIVEDQGFIDREFNRAFVQMQYFGYLRRNPDDAPDGSMSGYNFWLNKLNQ
ncbi:MAG: hypothetical protein DMF76_16055, partial [Acidobacteria bacterium]